MRRPSEYSAPELLVLVFGAVLLVTLVYGASTTGAAYSTFNPAWEGTSELRAEADKTGAETTVVSEPREYEAVPADGSIALILSPEEPYDPTQETIREFVEDGGTVVVADSSGTHANSLLEGIGASARIDGAPLRDHRHYHRAPTLPIATNTADHPYVVDSDELTLNRGSTIESGDATVLARSSEFAYLDYNENERIDEDETMDAYPVVTSETIGDGHVVTVSDASVFINVMLEQPGNRVFVQSMFADHDRVVFDVSHTEDAPPLSKAMLTVRESSAGQLLFGVAIVLLVAGVRERTAIGSKLRTRRLRTDDRNAARPDADRMKATLAERYPDWDEQRREQVVRSVVPDRNHEN